jgi:hypothetical protein
MPESFFPSWMQGSSPDWPLGARAAIVILGWVLTNRLLMIGDITVSFGFDFR